MTFDKWSAEPWQVVENIEFRSLTLTAVKPEGTVCMDIGHAVIYRDHLVSLKMMKGMNFRAVNEWQSANEPLIY